MAVDAGMGVQLQVRSDHGIQTGIAVDDRLRLLAIIALVSVIFWVDTLTTLGTAIAVLYGFVVMIAGTFLNRTRTLAVAGLCAGLTIVSFLWGHEKRFGLEPSIRFLVSLCAIVLATFMSLRNQKALAVLGDQAELLNCSHDAIIVTTPDGIISYWNQGAEVLYGFQAAEARARDMSDLLKTQSTISLAEVVAEMELTGRWEGELVHTRRDGENIVVASRWSKQLDQRGRLKAILKTNNDITEKKRGQDALAQAQTALSHAARISTLGELTASIAHEVNQPLAALVTNGEACRRWLRRDVPNIEAALDSVDKMISGGRLATQVVARLRALAKNSIPERLPVNLNDVVHDVLAILQNELLTRQVTLQLHLSPTPLWVLGDRIQLQQVVLNLLMNGMQAMTETAQLARVLVVTTSATTTEDGGYASVALRDFGPGISEDAATKIFSAFYSTKATGMGMGLSISRSIVEAHEGSIGFVNAEPAGAQFTVTLPVLNTEKSS